jgi:hypothetical protein
LAPPNRGGLSSTHIRGTHVPVEEPSTASGGDVLVKEIAKSSGDRLARVGTWVTSSASAELQTGVQYPPAAFATMI